MAEQAAVETGIKTVGELIKELKKFPSNARVLHSTDSEGNQYHGIYNVIGGTFGEDADDKDDERLTQNNLKDGGAYAIIWSWS